MITYSKRDEIKSSVAKKIARNVSLSQIYLFGSTSRKMDRLDSDIDICLVGSQHYLSRNEKDQITDILTDILLEEHIVINWIYINCKDWQANIIPIIKTIKVEGELLWATVIT